MKTLRKSRVIVLLAIVSVLLLVGGGQADATEVTGPGAGVGTGVVNYSSKPPNCSLAPCPSGTTAWTMNGASVGNVTVVDSANPALVGAFAGPFNLSTAGVGVESVDLGSGNIIGGNLSGISLTGTTLTASNMSGTFARLGPLLTIIARARVCVTVSGFPPVCAWARLLLTVTYTLFFSVSGPPLVIVFNASVTVTYAYAFCVGTSPPC